MSYDLVILLVLALFVGSICRLRGINAALPLIIVGAIAAGLYPELSLAVPDPESVMAYLLTPIIFAAGLASSAIDLHKVKRAVLLLAIVLVILTSVLVGGIATLLVSSMTFGVAFALGAVLSPTDAVAASAVAKKIRLPRRVMLIVEGESLANDGTALTVLRIATVAVVAGGVSMWQITTIAFAAVFGGIAIGVIGGWLATKGLSLIGDATICNVLGLITPFALYALSEEIGGSGLLTVVIAGVWIAQTTASSGTAHAFRIQSKSIWGALTFVLESIAFLLVGVEFDNVWKSIQTPHPGYIIGIALIISLAMLVLRFAFLAFSAWYMYRRNIEPHLSRSMLVKSTIAIGILGVRGPVSVLAAFSIPLTVSDGSPLPDRDLVLCITFVVVIISLLIAAGSKFIIARLNFHEESDTKMTLDARASMARAASVRLEEITVDGMDRRQDIPSSITDKFRDNINHQLEAATKKSTQDNAHNARIAREIHRELLKAERDELLRVQVEEGLPGDIVKTLAHELDLRQESIGS